MLMEEVAKLRKNHEEAVESFRDRAGAVKTEATGSLEEQRRRHEGELDRLRSTAARGVVHCYECQAPQCRGFQVRG